MQPGHEPVDDDRHGHGGEDEGAQRLELRIEGVDLVLEPLHLRGVHREPRPARSLALVRGAQIRREIEQVILDPPKHGIDVGRIPGEATPGTWDYSIPANTLRAFWDEGPVIEIHRSELGWTEGMRFQVVASRSNDPVADLVPSDSSMLYYRLGLGPGYGDLGASAANLPSPFSGVGQSPKPLEGGARS